MMFVVKNSPLRRHWARLFAILLLVGPLYGGARLDALGAGQAAGLDAKIDALAASHAAIAEQLKRLEAQVAELRQILLAATGAAAPGDTANDLALSIDGLPRKGNPNAPVVIIELSDFECPYCRAFVQNTQPALQREFIDTGKAELVFWHLPLSEIHAHAVKAAEAAECALRQGVFWEMHDAIFADQTKLDENSLVARAVALRLDGERFATCLRGETAALVQERRDAARKMGIGSTPTFLFGRRQADGTVRVLYRMGGAGDAAAFRKVIDTLLQQPQGAR